MSTDLGYKCSNFVVHRGAVHECFGKSLVQDVFIEVGAYRGDGFWECKSSEFPNGLVWLCEKHRFEDLIGELNL